MLDNLRIRLCPIKYIYFTSTKCTFNEAVFHFVLLRLHTHPPRHAAGACLVENIYLTCKSHPLHSQMQAVWHQKQQMFVRFTRSPFKTSPIRRGKPAHHFECHLVCYISFVVSFFVYMSLVILQISLQQLFYVK